MLIAETSRLHGNEGAGPAPRAPPANVNGHLGQRSSQASRVVSATQPLEFGEVIRECLGHAARVPHVHRHAAGRCQREAHRDAVVVVGIDPGSRSGPGPSIEIQSSAVNHGPSLRSSVPTAAIGRSPSHATSRCRSGAWFHARTARRSRRSSPVRIAVQSAVDGSRGPERASIQSVQIDVRAHVPQQAGKRHVAWMLSEPTPFTRTARRRALERQKIRSAEASPSTPGGPATGTASASRGIATPAIHLYTEAAHQRQRHPHVRLGNHLAFHLDVQTGGGSEQRRRHQQAADELARYAAADRDPVRRHRSGRLDQERREAGRASNRIRARARSTLRPGRRSAARASGHAVEPVTAPANASTAVSGRIAVPHCEEQVRLALREPSAQPRTTLYRADCTATPSERNASIITRVSSASSSPASSVGCGDSAASSNTRSRCFWIPAAGPGRRPARSVRPSEPPVTARRYPRAPRRRCAGCGWPDRTSARASVHRPSPAPARRPRASPRSCAAPGQRRSIGQRDVTPHFGAAGCDPGEIAKARTASDSLRCASGWPAICATRAKANTCGRC